MKRSVFLTAPLVLAAAATKAGTPVKVGVLLPLSGNAAAAGQAAKAAVELAVEIAGASPASTPHKSLPCTPITGAIRHRRKAMRCG
jgi:outer membrane PBP1 activator LpoA protein